MADNDRLPPKIDLDKLFPKKSVFDSSDDMRDAGFDILRESKNEKVVVASHRSAPGFLFKKFLNDVSLSPAEQLAVYERRVNGARALKDHLEALKIKNIIVPRKWLCELPPRFHTKKRSAHIIVVDRCDILDEEESERRYRRLDKDQLRGLCTIFFAFRRVDFTPKNAPFTRDGKIAFIDTGYLARITKKIKSRQRSYEKNVGKLFTDKDRRFGEKLWDELVNLNDLLTSKR
jgi:hypothetical protein